MGIKAIDWVRKTANEALAESRHFHPTADIRDLAKMARPIVSEGNQTGEGWFLTGEMMELIHDGVPNIVCIQPFACLPNHIVGKGVIKEIRREYPKANIAAIDYSGGADGDGPDIVQPEGGLFQHLHRLHVRRGRPDSSLSALAGRRGEVGAGRHKEEGTHRQHHEAHDAQHQEAG